MINIIGKILSRRFLSDTVVYFYFISCNIYHCVYALYIWGSTAAAVVSKALVDVGAIIAISAVAVRTSTASE